MKFSFSEFLNSISIWIVFVPLLLGLILFKKLSKNSKLVLILVILACIPQFIHGVNGFKKFEALTYNVYTISEFIIWYFIFKNRFVLECSKIVFKISAVIYFICSVLLLIFFSITKSFISEWVCLNNFLISFWILFYILEQLYTDKIVLGFKNSFSWYISFALLYSLCTFIVFSLWYYKEDEIPVLKDIKIVHNIFNVLLYLGFSGGFLVDYITRKQIEKNNES